MLLEEELARGKPSKATNTWKSNNWNRDKKDKGLTSEGVHAYTSLLEPRIKGNNLLGLYDDIL